MVREIYVGETLQDPWHHQALLVKFESGTDDFDVHTWALLDVDLII